MRGLDAGGFTLPLGESGCKAGEGGLDVEKVRHMWLLDPSPRPLLRPTLPPSRRVKDGNR